MADNIKEKLIPVPDDRKGYIIGRQYAGLKEISALTKAQVFKKSGEIYAKGTDEQIDLAEKMIQEKLQGQRKRKVVEKKVPKKFIGLVLGENGRTARRLKAESKANIHLSSDEGEFGVFTITGFPGDCSKAEALIEELIREKDGEPFDQIDVKVESKFVGLVNGQGGKNLRRLETKSGAQIRSPLRKYKKDDGFAVFAVSGTPEQCREAKSLIEQSIVSCKDYNSRKAHGGDTHFVYFGRNYGNATFVLKKDESHVPNSNAFVKGGQYRIEMASQCNNVREITETTISPIKGHILKSLQRLRQRNDKKQLSPDLWCHFGKVFVHNVDEGEEKQEFRKDDLDGRLRNLMNTSETIAPNADDPSAGDQCWKATFQEGIDPSDINAEELKEDDSGGDRVLHHTHTHWLHEYQFKTPSGNKVTFKIWEGMKEPPRDVKNLMKRVVLKGHENDIVAWLCETPIAVLRGEIMNPSSEYDCRIKLRTGRRFAPEKKGEADKENELLCNYLSDCILDDTSDRHCLSFPSVDLPKGFECSFNRSAKQKIFSSDGENNEKFTVVVMNEDGLDSEQRENRDKKQVIIRVTLDSWSEALISGEWEPEVIVSKLPEFMSFIQNFQDQLFEQYNSE